MLGGAAMKLTMAVRFVVTNDGPRVAQFDGLSIGAGELIDA
jgi:hypothetical protein